MPKGPVIQPGAVLRVQTSVGNAAAATMAASLQRARVAPKEPAKLTGPVKTNDPKLLAQFWAEDLLPLYAMKESTYLVRRGAAAARYTREWVTSPDGEAQIQRTLRQKYESKIAAGKRADVIWALSIIKAMSGDDRRKEVLRDLVRDELRRVPGVPALSKGERDTALMQTFAAIQTSFTNYTAACLAEQARIAKILADQQQAREAIFSIFLGFLAPGAGKFLAVHAAKGIDKIGFVAKEFRDAASAWAQAHDDLAQHAFQSMATTGFKALSSAAAEGDVEKLVDSLQDAQNTTVRSLNARLPDLTDVELLEVYAAFTSKYTSKPAYQAEIQSLVGSLRNIPRIVKPLPIGNLGSENMPPTYEYTAAVYITMPDGPRLALVDVSSTWPLVKRQFLAWVHADHKAQALARMRQRDLQVATVAKSEVRGVP